MSDEKIHPNQFVKRVLPLLLGIIVVVLLASVALAQDGGWTTPVLISTPSEISWFPDLTVDVYGTPHVIWCRTEPVEYGGLSEQVMYTSFQGDRWKEPNDIVPPSAEIVRNAIAADRSGNVHMIFGGSVRGILTLYYQRAAVSDAWSAAAWSEPHLINQGIAYMGDIALDSKGVVHVIYDDTRQNPQVYPPIRADIFYRRSENGGRIWSTPINLYSQPLTGSARPYMKIDANDVIHVTLDEGWDRLSGARPDNEEYHGAYVSSMDGGQTWTEPYLIEHPDRNVAQLTAGSDNESGVLLVWRSMSEDYERIFYQWSDDGGRTWQEPDVIPWIFARPFATFDMYDLTTDSAGHIHLLAVGRSTPEPKALLGVYHLIWDGERWSAPTRIFAQEGLYPEYPKIVIHEGNQLHAAWFTREGSVWEQDVNRVIWYSRSQVAAPHRPVTPMPTEMPESTKTVAPTPAPVPTPTLYQFNRDESGLPSGLHTESDELFRLVIALFPVILLIGVLIAVRMNWFHRSR
ncbi:MAG: hypothetical protein DRJ03_17420 [Chloroflexi bacterium]|nr:MAG: hypothetical protein DRI81_16655 [Chloroflexota bacterium]RLC83361.1 MAG: hypothetical protein DRJ03_17420 [Chloroflexota bacterium]